MFTPGRVLLEPTEHEFERHAVLNPGCILEKGSTHIFYRAVRDGNYSSVGYARLHEGVIVERYDQPVLTPEFEWEQHGIEDPRIAKIDGVYYMVYIAYDGLNARIAYATTDKLPFFQKQGVISPPMPYHEVAELCRQREHHAVNDFFHRYFVSKYEEDPQLKDLLVYEKDAFLFPRKIGNRFALVHRVFPEVQLIYFDDFKQLQTVDYWAGNLYELKAHTILRPEFWFENRHIGGGCPPIETEAVWLFIYHAVQENELGERTYHAAAALLDLINPTIVLGRLSDPLFSPQQDFEMNGDVSRVVFPTGATLEGDTLSIYYGAADSRIAVKKMSLLELLSDLGYKPTQM